MILHEINYTAIVSMHLVLWLVESCQTSNSRHTKPEWLVTGMVQHFNLANKRMPSIHLWSPSRCYSKYSAYPPCLWESFAPLPPPCTTSHTSPSPPPCILQGFRNSFYGSLSMALLEKTTNMSAVLSPIPTICISMCTRWMHGSPMTHPPLDLALFGPSESPLFSLSSPSLSFFLSHPPLFPL